MPSRRRSSIGRKTRSSARAAAKRKRETSEERYNRLEMVRLRNATRRNAIRNERIDYELSKQYDGEEINVKFRNVATQKMFDQNFRIIYKSGDMLRIICNHCKSVMKGPVNYSYSFRRHLKMKHADIFEKNSSGGMSSTFSSGVSRTSIKPQYTEAADDFLIDEIKKEPIIEEINMDELFGGFKEGQDRMQFKSYAKQTLRSGASSDLLVDEIKKEPMDDGEQDNVCIDELDLNELAPQERKSNWARQKVEIVREEADPDEFVKEEPQFCDEY